MKALKVKTPFTAEWYRARAEDEKGSGKTISMTEHFIRIAEVMEAHTNAANNIRDRIEVKQYQKDLLRFNARLQADVTVNEVAS